MTKQQSIILGASIVGANATDYIAKIGLAMEHKLTVSDITYTTHPHPTFNEIVWEAARAAHLKLELSIRLPNKPQGLFLLILLLIIKCI